MVDPEIIRSTRYRSLWERFDTVRAQHFRTSEVKGSYLWKLSTGFSPGIDASGKIIVPEFAPAHAGAGEVEIFDGLI